MHEAATSPSENDQRELGPPESLHELDHQIEHVAHLLPSQGPITIFVHHNTLHAFEDFPFDQGVRKGTATYGCHPYLPEDFYRKEAARGRITPQDIAETLIDDLGEDGDYLIGFMGPRYYLRFAMLEHPLRVGNEAELHWITTESRALKKFRTEAPESARRWMVEQTKPWVLQKPPATATPTEHNGHNGSHGHTLGRGRETIDALRAQFDAPKNPEKWNPAHWEAFTLNLLWRICHIGVHGIRRFGEAPPLPVRHRDLLLLNTGRDTDLVVNELLVRFCASFLDQGFATWVLPNRDDGFFRSFFALFRSSHPLDPSLQGLPAELKRIEARGISPLESIDESLHLLGVGESEREDYITQTLLALRGWAGMIHQMETNAEWTAHPAPAGSLQHYLAVRLILERVVLSQVAKEALGHQGDLRDLRSTLRHQRAHPPRVSVDQRAYLVFQLAQVRGWSPRDLDRLSKQDWSRLVEEIEAFNSLERRRIYHHAYERHYRNHALDAVSIHAAKQRAKGALDQPEFGREVRPLFQLITCIDDREESFRRNLEEISPDCETYGVAGFFGVAMYYQGASDAHYRPLCPVVITPQHYVKEQAAYSLTSSSRQRAETRRILGTATRQWHMSSRTFLGGILTTMLGSLASIPMITRILFPRLTSQLRRSIGSFVQPPPVTELQLLRFAEPAGPEGEHLGYSFDEMSTIVERVLRDIGLTRNFSRLIVLCGHGSGSLNNPHESAYNCGACSGGRGGANARAFAQMANDPRVRAKLVQNGLIIPEDTAFLGAYHDTCDEDVVYFDLDRLPMTHRKEFEVVRRHIDQARERNAHERCRRFESAALSLTPREALEHVETRSQDLSQARPEYNHATNALCFVGRRGWSRSLFLDRRSFLTSYDPTQDDANHTILARILAAVIPVCAGISLEYYFSRVDEAGYGCGSKLPHNVTSLLGVMEGAAGDLRTGLSQQMVEIHEPVRILFVIETTPDAMRSIMKRNETIGRLVGNEWVQLATLDPSSGVLHLYRNGDFQPYQVGTHDLPTVATSPDWYRNQRDHLGFASIIPPAPKDAA
jgi:uncharacterized protein YbcC (UPF0753/DUF2309 family)